jgi:hypothetical protein
MRPLPAIAPFPRIKEPSGNDDVCIATELVQAARTLNTEASKAHPDDDKFIAYVNSFMRDYDNYDEIPNAARAAGLEIVGEMRKPFSRAVVESALQAGQPVIVLGDYGRDVDLPNRGPTGRTMHAIGIVGPGNRPDEFLVDEPDNTVNTPKNVDGGALPWSESDLEAFAHFNLGGEDWGAVFSVRAAPSPKG